MPLLVSKARARRPGLLALALTIVCGLPAAAVAHDPGLSALNVVVGSGRVDAVLSIAAADTPASPEFDDLLSLSLDGAHMKPLVQKVRREANGDLRVEQQFAGRFRGRLAIRSNVLRQLPRGHRQLVTMRTGSGQPLAERLLDASSTDIVVDLRRAARTGPAHFFSLGIHHIATGYDHLLFLAAMLLVVTGLREAAAIVTAFTAAHAAALLAAIVRIIAVPTTVVEPMIAASIVWVGLENVVRREFARRWQAAFVFGLVHGLAFADALRDLSGGDAGVSLPARLAFFNLGIEAGQLAFTIALLPILLAARRWPRQVARLQTVGSSAIVLAGGYWLMVRCWP